MESKDQSQLKKDLESLIKANPPRIIDPPTWSRADLLHDFQQKPDYADFKATLIGAGVSNLVDKATHVASKEGGVAISMIDKVLGSLTSLVEKQVIGSIVGYALQSKLESRAEEKLIRGFGTQFILMSISLAQGIAISPTSPVTLLFTVILFLHEKKKEKRLAMDKELVENVMQKAEEIRAKAQATVDQKHKLELERFLLSEQRPVIEDNTVVGTYQYVNKSATQAIPLTVGDCAQLMDLVRGNLQPYVHNEDLLKGCAYLNLRPFGSTQTLTLTQKQQDLFNLYLQDCKDANYGPDVEEHDDIPATPPTFGSTRLMQGKAVQGKKRDSKL